MHQPTASASHVRRYCRVSSLACSIQGLPSGRRNTPGSAAKLAGPKTSARANSVQVPAKAGASSQPSTRKPNNSTGVRLRRKLSRIFHRDSPESGLAAVSLQRGNAIAQPGSNLPVAAYPAVAAVHIDQQPRGNSFEQFHVVDQAAAGEAAFDQVVAQQAVFGKTAFAGRLEGLHVVDPFADETALPKQVVIEIAGLERIGIDSRIARHQAAEAAAMRLGHGGGYPRLKHGVARNHHARMRIDFRLVQADGPHNRPTPGRRRAAVAYRCPE